MSRLCFNFCSGFKSELGKFGRFIFPDDDPRPQAIREKLSIMDYHKEYIHNENGYENFIGLISYFLRSKYNYAFFTKQLTI